MLLIVCISLQIKLYIQVGEPSVYIYMYAHAVSYEQVRVDEVTINESTSLPAWRLSIVEHNFYVHNSLLTHSPVIFTHGS